jgi:hypothetical protein
MGDNFADLPTVFLPVLWFSAEANVTEAMAAQIWWLVNIPFIARYIWVIDVQNLDIVGSLLHYNQVQLGQC